MPPETEQTEEVTERDGLEFAALLATMRKGAVAADLTDALDGLVKEVTSLGKKGELHLKLTITPIEGQLDATITISDEIVVKPPKRKNGESIYFLANHRGQVSRNQPQQSIGL